MHGVGRVNNFHRLVVQQDALSIIINFVCILISDKQVNYKQNSADFVFYHEDATLWQTGIELAVYQVTRNKNMIDHLRFFNVNM